MGLNVSFANLSDTTSFFSGEYDVAAVVITVCCALSLYNALELLLLIFTTFKSFRGLYFWSLLVASFGVIPYTFGFMIEYFKLTRQVAGLVITCVGWPMMVTGQSLVLYSRLHVVFGKSHRNLLRAVKWMIIVDAIVFHVPTEVAVFGAYYAPPRLHFTDAYKYIEKIQMTGFTLQEFILSGLYVWKTLDILHSTSHQRKRTSRIMWQLFSINVLIVLMDIALLVVEYQDRHVIEQAIKQVVYSVKLKLEFAILSKLAGLAKDGDGSFTAAFEDYDGLCAGESWGASGSERSISAIGRKSSSIAPQPNASNALQHSAPLEMCKSGCSYRGAGTSGTPHFSSLDGRTARQSQISAATTSDDRRRRRTIDEDLYLDALRDVNG